MAKAFDLIHKVSTEDKEESRIPFEDENPSEKPKRRPRLEMAFFYLLLFIIFFVMGSTLLSPNFLAGLMGKKEGTQTSPSPVTKPEQGLVIEKQGQSVEQAKKDLGISPTPTPVASPAAAAPAPVTSQTTEAASTAAKIQVLNGTTREGAAAATRTKLANKGIVVASIGNYHKRSVQRTTVFYRPEFKTAAAQVQSITGGILSETTTGIGSYDILVVIGLR